MIIVQNSHQMGTAGIITRYDAGERGMKNCEAKRYLTKQRCFYASRHPRVGAVWRTNLETRQGLKPRRRATAGGGGQDVAARILDLPSCS